MNSRRFRAGRLGRVVCLLDRLRCVGDLGHNGRVPSDVEIFLMTNPFRRPNIFRVRLRTFFALVTVAAIASGLAVDRIKRARIQAKNIRLLRNSDSKILFDFEVSPNPNEGSIRRYFRRKYGPDYVDSVHSIHTAIRGPLHDGKTFDEPTAADVLSAVSQLGSVRKLTIAGHRHISIITDRDMLGLANLEHLEHLEIRLLGPTEQGLKYLGNLKQLNYLDISGVSTT